MKKVLVLTCIMVFALALAAFAAPAAPDKPLEFKQMARPMACLLGVIGYVSIIKITGFFVASTIFTLVFMWLYGMRSVKKMVAVTLGMDLFLYVLFVIQLKVQLPQGILNLM